MILADRLAVLDWGIGGMGFVRAWRRRRPDSALLYWSDTGATPYGKLPETDLRARVEAVCRALRRRGAGHVVVACNAASTVVDETLEAPLPVTGIIDHAVRATVAALGASQLRGPETALRVGVLGGRRTIESGLYRRKLEARGFRVEQSVAQPLSALVERGVLEGAELRSALRDILGRLEGPLDGLLLACTHYPAIRGPIEAMVDVHVIDPVEALADWIDDRRAEVSSRRPDDDSMDSFLTTGSPDEMRRAAAAAFGVDVEMPRRVDLAEPTVPPAGIAER